MRVRIIDENGATGVIGNDLKPESEEVSEEVRRFLERTRRSAEGPVTLDSLEPDFLVDLYVGTSIRKAEPVSQGGDRRVNRWEPVRLRYDAPTSDAGLASEGDVSRGDGPTPDAATPSPRVSEADEADE